MFFFPWKGSNRLIAFSRYVCCFSDGDFSRLIHLCSSLDSFDISSNVVRRIMWFLLLWFWCFSIKFELVLSNSLRNCSFDSLFFCDISSSRYLLAFVPIFQCFFRHVIMKSLQTSDQHSFSVRLYQSQTV